MSVERAAALADLLDVAPPDPRRGDCLPLMWHLAYFWNHFPQAAIGPDGHKATASNPGHAEAPRRRMFAGGRVNMRRGLRFGEDAVMQTSVLDKHDKQGRTGPLTFVKVCREVSQGGTIALLEEQDIVYLGEGPTPVRSVDIAPAGDGHEGLDGCDGASSLRLATTPPLLFRFSALTYNAHRIHYDRPYATGVEGFPGLVVHGPLQALAMAEAIRRLMPSAGLTSPTTFEYRLLAPLFDHDDLFATAVGQDSGYRAEVRSSNGLLTARAHLRLCGNDRPTGYPF